MGRTVALGVQKLGEHWAALGKALERVGMKAGGRGLLTVIKPGIGGVPVKLQPEGAVLPNSSNMQMPAVKTNAFQKYAVFLLVTIP